MQRKRMIMVLCVFLVALVFVPQTVQANSPPPASHCMVELSNLPENAWAVDLLVPLTVGSAYYTQATDLPEGMDHTAPILLYDQDGYMSYTFHYQLASSQYAIESSAVTFFLDNYRHFSHFQSTLLRLAILDRAGQILQISEPFEYTATTTGFLYYDGATRQVQVEQRYHPMYDFVLIALVMIVSIACEVIVGLFFKMKIFSVVVVNFLSQTVMWLLYFWLGGTIFTSYVWLIVVLEVFVYAAEYGMYCWTKRDVSRKKILVYTVAANTVSLVIGLLLFN